MYRHLTKGNNWSSSIRNLYIEADNLTYDMTMGGKTNSLTPEYKWPKEIWRNDGALNLIKGQMIPWCWLTDLKMSSMKGLEYTRHVFFTLEEKYICTVENILKSMRTILMENIRYTPTLPSNSVLKILVLAGWRKKTYQFQNL